MYLFHLKIKKVIDLRKNSMENNSEIEVSGKCFLSSLPPFRIVFVNIFWMSTPPPPSHFKNNFYVPDI